MAVPGRGRPDSRGVRCAVGQPGVSIQTWRAALPVVRPPASFVTARLHGSLGISRNVAPLGGIACQARGFALCIFASFIGVAVSVRQILLHIVPPDSGYGPPVTGTAPLHMGARSFLLPDS